MNAKTTRPYIKDCSATKVVEEEKKINSQLSNKLLTVNISACLLKCIPAVYS